MLDPNVYGQDKLMENKSIEDAFQDEKKADDGTVREYRTRTARASRSIWKTMMLSLLTEMIADTMRRTMGWVCTGKKNAVLTTLEHVFT